MSVQADRPSVGGQQYSEDHRLRANAVSLVGDWIASVANVAPSSSVAFTLALLLGFAGYASPLRCWSWAPGCSPSPPATRG